MSNLEPMSNQDPISHQEKIAFLDLASLHQELEEELIPVFRKALRGAAFVGGPSVEEFEKEFASFCDAQCCVGVASGTDAVRFALMAAGVRLGDTVVTVAHTFIATTEAITQAGARPDFVDIDERTYSMDPGKLREYLEEKCYFDDATRRLYHRVSRSPVTAIVPVHIYGQTADMDSILELAEKYNLLVIEDACQAHGAEYFSKRSNSWRKAGSIGHAGAFSFYPGKNLGACGEAGAVTTNDPAIARKMRVLRDHGQEEKYYHSCEGYNGRLDAVQAGFLSVKLRYLADWNRKRRAAAQMYDDLFASMRGVNIPFCPEWTRPVFHLYVIRTAQRDALRKHLAAARIDTGIHYPVPLHLQEAYRNMHYPVGSFPVTEKVSSEILSLPMYPQLSAAQARRVALQVGGFLSPQIVLQPELAPARTSAAV